MRSYIYALTKATEYGMLDLIEKSEENQLTPEEFENSTKIIQEGARKIAEIYHIFCCSPDHVLTMQYDSLIRSKDYRLTPSQEELKKHFEDTKVMAKEVSEEEAKDLRISVAKMVFAKAQSEGLSADKLKFVKSILICILLTAIFNWPTLKRLLKS